MKFSKDPRAVALNGGLFALSFFLVFRSPLSRGFTLVQLLGVGLLTLFLFFARRPQVSKRARVYLLILVLTLVWSLLTTYVGLLHNANDLLQGFRDLRDFSVFAYIAICLIITGLVYDVKYVFWGTIMAMVVEIALRSAPSIYVHLYNMPLGEARYSGGFISPNDYGVLASIVFVAALSYIGRAKHKIPYIASLGVASYILITSLSRGSVLGAALIGGIALWINRRSFRLAGGLVIFSFLASAFLTLTGGGDLLRTVFPRTPLEQFRALSMINQRLSPGKVAVGAQVRKKLANAAWEMIKAYPLCGAGWGGFKQQNEQYGGTGTASPHNELLKFGAESGMPGALLGFLLLGYPLWVGFISRKNPSSQDVFLMILCFTIAEFFFSHLVRPGISVIYAILIGRLFVTDEPDSDIPALLGTSGERIHTASPRRG